jgi:hypothetical protein
MMIKETWLAPSISAGDCLVELMRFKCYLLINVGYLLTRFKCYTNILANKKPCYSGDLP